MLTQQKMINASQYTVAVDASENTLEIVKDKIKLAPAALFHDGIFEINDEGKKTSILQVDDSVAKYKCGSIFIQQEQAEKCILDAIFKQLEIVEKKRAAKKTEESKITLQKVMGSLKYKKIGNCTVEGQPRMIQLKVDEAHPNRYKCIFRGAKQETAGIEFLCTMTIADFKKMLLKHYDEKIKKGIYTFIFSI